MAFTDSTWNDILRTACLSSAAAPKPPTSGHTIGCDVGKAAQLPTSVQSPIAAFAVAPLAAKGETTPEPWAPEIDDVSFA